MMKIGPMTLNTMKTDTKIIEKYDMPRMAERKPSKMAAHAEMAVLEQPVALEIYPY